MLLPALQQLVQFFTVLDSFHCFLVTRRLTCTLTRLLALMRSSGALHTLTHTHTHTHMDVCVWHVLTLQALCPRVLQVTLLATGNSVDVPLPHTLTHIDVSGSRSGSGRAGECVSECVSGEEALYPHLEVVFFIEGTRKVSTLSPVHSLTHSLTHSLCPLSGVGSNSAATKGSDGVLCGVLQTLS
jgi:hypothetical protein